MSGTSTIHSLERSPSYSLTRLLIDEPDFDWWPEAKGRLEYLMCLEKGWDGYSAGAISFENAYFSLKVLERLYCPGLPAPQIVPGTEGDLQIEWHGDVDDIELHIIRPNNVNFWYCNAETGAVGKEMLLTNNFIKVTEIIKNMMEHIVESTKAAAA